MILPVLAMTGIVAFTVLRLSRRGLPVDDVGLWILGVTWLYGALPPLTFLVFGFEIVSFMDMRLIQIRPGPEDVARVAWLYALFMGCFAVAHLMLRGDPGAPKPLAFRDSQALAVLPLLAGTLAILELVTPAADSYMGGYAAVQALPLGLRQVYVVAATSKLVLVILALTFMFSRHRRWWPALVVWLAAQLGAAVSVGGSRTGLMVTLGLCLVLYHRFIRPVRMWQALVAAVLSLVLFVGLGLVRAGQSIFVAGEFLSVFTNALDLLHEQPTDIPLGVYLTEFFGFIPSQFWPIEKIDPSSWYVSRFYPDYAEEGGGFAFGAIAQAVIGFGSAEVAVRGFVTGGLAAIAFRWYRRRSGSVWVTATYLWLLVFGYQSVRASSFMMFGLLVQQVLMALACVFVLGLLLRAVLAPGRAAPIPLANTTG